MHKIPLVAAAVLTLTTPLAAQSGDQFIALSGSTLMREDGPFTRNVTSFTATHGAFVTDDLQVLTHLGYTTFDNTLPPDDQQVTSGSVGLGLRYTGIPGGALTGTLFYSQLDETLNSGGATRMGSGDLVTFSLNYRQFVLVTERLTVAGSAGLSVAWTEFEPAGITPPSEITSNRTTAGLSATFAATQTLDLSAGLTHVHANQPITISGADNYTRASIGAAWQITPDLQLSAGYAHGLNGDDRHEQVSFGILRRF